MRSGAARMPTSVAMLATLLACSRPERAPLPDLGPTMRTLDRAERYVEASPERECAVPMQVLVRADCFYPQRIATMEVARMEKGEKR
jgi:hypothetical protein